MTDHPFPDGTRVRVDESDFFPTKTGGYRHELWPVRDCDREPVESKHFPAFFGEVTFSFVGSNRGARQLAYHVVDAAGDEWFRWASEVHLAPANDSDA